MHNISLKNSAKKMRIRGHTVRNIANELKVSFSTVSFWCRDLKLSEKVIRKMKFQKKEKSIKGLLKYSEFKRNQRMENASKEKEKGARMVDTLSKRDKLMIGLGLYWGEGYKESNGEMGFTNSNPYMIKFYINWLLNIFGVLKTDLIFRLALNKVFEKDEKHIRSFWKKYLNIDDNQFTKTTFIKSNLKKADVKNVNTYKGILRVKVRRGLSLKNKILGAINYIANS